VCVVLPAPIIFLLSSFLFLKALSKSRPSKLTSSIYPLSVRYDFILQYTSITSSNSKPGLYYYQDGKQKKKFDQADITAYQNAIKGGKMAIQPLYYESTWGSVGSQTGKYNPVGTETIGDYSTDRAVNLKHTVGNGMIITEDGVDPTTGQVKYKKQMLKA
jgi:hypothetical protein